MEEKEKNLATQAFVTRQFAKSGKDVGDLRQHDEVLEVHKFVTEPARVFVEMGLTVNLGNYESARITVALSVPCYHEEHNEAFLYARGWVEERAKSEAQEARRFAQSRVTESPRNF